MVAEELSLCLFGQKACDEDGDVDWCIVLVEMPLTRFEEWWPLPWNLFLNSLKTPTYYSLLTVCPVGIQGMLIMPVLSKKVIIERLWVDLLRMAFLSRGEPVCIISSSQIILCIIPTLTWNCALIVSVDTQRPLSMKFFIWPINSGVLTSLLLPHNSSFFTDSLPSLNLLCHSKTDARFRQDGQKVVWSIPYVSVAFFPRLKQNFIAYRSSKVSSRPDCIFEIHQLW